MKYPMDRASSNNLQTSEAMVAIDAIKLISRLRKHIQNDDCQCCEKILLDTFFIQNNVAGSTGDQAIEPATDFGARTDTNDDDIRRSDILQNV
jgi:hypothetical protein